MSAIDWVSGNVVGSIWFAHLEAEDEPNNVDCLDPDKLRSSDKILCGLRAHAEGEVQEDDVHQWEDVVEGNSDTNSAVHEVLDKQCGTVFIFAASKKSFTQIAKLL